MVRVLILRLEGGEKAMEVGFVYRFYGLGLKKNK